MPKDFALSWILEPLEDLDTYLTKRMFGGLAAYLDGKMIALLAESPGDREWKGQTFDFEIWDGLLIPTSREHHESLQKEFPYLLNHPVLGKWL